MRQVMHQFGKEFRYLRVRWCVLLAVVALDLAVSMEWVLPMKPLVHGSGVYWVSFDILMRLLLWMAVWWFMLSVPPEESASGGRSYALTRPLSPASYWGARLMVWVVLVMGPLMLESAVYLWLNGRPWGDVALGMAERAWAAGSMTLWVLPLPLLLRGWERYAAIVLVVLSIDSPLSRVMSKVFEMLHLTYDAPQLTMEFGRPVQAAWLVGLLVPLVVLWHRRRPLGRVARMGAVVVLTLLQQGVAASTLFEDGYEKPHDSEEIRKLTAGRGVVMPESEWQFQQEDDRHGGEYISLRAYAQLEGMPEEYVPYWRDNATTMMQDGKVLPRAPGREARRQPYYAVGFQCQFLPMAGTVPGLKMPGLLSVDAGGRRQNMSLNLSQPAQLKQPVSVSLDLSADWMRLRELGTTPLKAGAKFLTPEFGIELLEVKANDDGRGERSDGCVTVVYRLSARCFEWQNTLLPLWPHAFIVSPKNRFMWQFLVHSGYEQMRGANLGWCHMLQQQTFQMVTAPGTGVTAENLQEQKLMWVKPEYLGSTRHQTEIKDVVIGEHLLKRDGWPKSKPAIEAGNLREAFLKQVRGMPRPAEGAEREEVARYVAAVYAASHVYGDRRENERDGKPKWPGDDREVCRLLAPFLVEHADLFRAALPYDYAELTQGVLHEVVLQAGIPGVRRSEKTGMAMYEREVPVADKPGQVRKRVMETLWLPDWRPDDLDAYVAAIREHSDEPLWPLMDDKPRTTEEVLADYARTFDCGTLRWLMKQPDVKYRERAERLTREAFAQLPAATNLQRPRVYEAVLFSAVALGMPEALDWLLRMVALKDDKYGGGEMHHHAMFDSLGERRPDFKTQVEFILSTRRHSAKDYRYNKDKMIWELLPDRP
jgi:hypothetical protein